MLSMKFGFRAIMSLFLQCFQVGVSSGKSTRSEPSRQLLALQWRELQIYPEPNSIRETPAD